MVYPRNPGFLGSYLCVFTRSICERTSLPQDTWHCIVEKRLLQTRIDLGELFRWISEDITKKGLDVI